MESKVEHREAPKEHATVKHVGGWQEWYGGQNLATDSCLSMKEHIWGNCGSQKKFTTAEQ
jgi:hypothetical protein